jgi:outer membrane protein insertion porin family
VPVEERFFAGGSRSVRGWARQQLGPKDDENRPTGGFSTIEASLEPRISLFGPLSMVVFMDVGNVWQQTEDFSLNEIRLSAGGGLRYSTPIGPVGIDAARPVWDNNNQWQIHFNIGHAF